MEERSQVDDRSAKEGNKMTHDDACEEEIGGDQGKEHKDPPTKEGQRIK